MLFENKRNKYTGKSESFNTRIITHINNENYQIEFKVEDGSEEVLISICIPKYTPNSLQSDVRCREEINVNFSMNKYLLKNAIEKI